VKRAVYVITNVYITLLHLVVPCYRLFFFTGYSLLSPLFDSRDSPCMLCVGQCSTGTLSGCFTNASHSFVTRGGLLGPQRLLLDSKLHGIRNTTPVIVQ